MAVAVPQTHLEAGAIKPSGRTNAIRAARCYGSSLTAERLATPTAFHMPDRRA